MIDTRKYLVASTALSVVFHLVLFTLANRLPAFQQTAISSKEPPKRKTVKLRSYKLKELEKNKSTRLKNALKIKNSSEQLSAALKAIQPKLQTPQLKTKTLSQSPQQLAKHELKSPNLNEAAQKLPESFYHIEIKNPVKTSDLKSGPSLESKKLKIKAPSSQIRQATLASSANALSGGAPQVGIRRSIPKISLPKINFKKPSNLYTGRKLSSPKKDTLPDKIVQDVPGQMEHFLNIQPHVYIDDLEQKGYFKLELQINDNARGLNPIDKDTYFIIDTSRSIVNKQLEQFIAGTLDGLSTLGSNDGFNTVIFTVEGQKAFQSFQKISPEAIKTSKDFLSFYRFLGGQTDIYNSIKPYVHDAKRINNRPQQIFLMTDGVSTATQSPENSEIIKEITNGNNADISIFSFATGKHTNSFLVDFLTYRNRGDSLIIEEIEDSAKELTKFIDERAEIIVTDLSHRYNGSSEDDVFPKKLPHLYRNRTLSVFGTFELDEEDAMIQILGQSSTGSRQLIYKINFADARSASPELAKSWAAQKIFHLIGQLTDNPDEKVINEIYKLQQKFKVYVPYALPKAKKSK